MATQGENRVYGWISDELDRQGKLWRGVHELSVHYKQSWPHCGGCNQAIRTDANLAYAMFLESDLYWDGEKITHETLKSVLLGKSDEDRDSGVRFRSPGTYGIDPLREWGRRILGRDIVLCDLDLAVRRYGPRFGLNPYGDLMLIEKKESWGSPIKKAPSQQNELPLDTPEAGNA